MANEPDEVNPPSHRPPGPPQSPDENPPGAESSAPADPDSGESEPSKSKKEPRPEPPETTDSVEDETQPSTEEDLSGGEHEIGAGQEETIASQEEGASVSPASTEEAAETEEFTEAAAEESSPHDDPHHHYHHHDEDHEPAAESAVAAWDEEEEGGGPVKSFLEHLEDFRWTIIRCLAALVIGMVVCLVAGSKIVELLKKPLYRAQELGGKIQNPVILFQAGTNVWTINLDTNKQFGPISLGTNIAIKLVMQPIQVGTNMLLALKQEPVKPEEIPVSYQITLKNLGPVSPFVVAIKIALFGGIGLASPFILLFVGQFVVPALRKKEKKYLFRAVFIGAFLFCCGVLFCYFLMLQVALNAAVQFSRWMNFEADIWRAEEYIGFVVKFMLGMGLSFELPVVLLTLVKLELIDYHTLKRFRPYWVIVNLVIAAILTPPDVVSQLLMAIPLQVLFEVSVLIAWYWHHRDKKRREREFGTA
jgi:Tat protein translocase TatC